MFMFKWLMGFIFMIVPLISVAEISISKQASVIIGTEMVLKSAILKKEIPIKISLPTNFSLSSTLHSYPVIFVEGKHGIEFFQAVSGIVKHLADVERMPETIVVSINGESPSPDIYHHNMWGKRSPDKWASWGEPNKYHAFFKEELLPFLKKRYRANDSRAVIGVSGSSFFPFYNLTQQDNLFDTYVFLKVSDILGMGYSADSTLIGAMETRLIDPSKPKPLLFFASTREGLSFNKRYQDNFNELTQRLSSIKNLSFSSKIYDNEGSYDALLKTILDVIELKYPKHVWTADYQDIVNKPGNALENLDKYFQQLSEHYGFAIFPRSARFNNINELSSLSRYLINSKRTEEALQVAKRHTEYQPKSWQAYESLAKALEANGRVDRAILTVKSALKLTDTDINRNQLQQYLAKLNTQSVEN